MKLLWNIDCHHESSCLHDLLPLNLWSIPDLNAFTSAPATVSWALQGGTAIPRPGNHTGNSPGMRRWGDTILCVTLGCTCSLSHVALGSRWLRQSIEELAHFGVSLSLSVTRTGILVTGHKIVRRRTDNAVRLHLCTTLAHSDFFPTGGIVSHSSGQAVPR